MTRNLDGAFRVRPLVLDGALGTEMEGRGVNTSGKSWTARGLISHPDLIYRVHREYLWEGADILTANTFRTNVRALKDTGLDAEALTKKAVRIARKARREKNPLIRVAGSIDEARVDIILIETMNTLREALCALQAAKEESSKYVWVSIVPKDGETMLDGTPLDYAVARLKEGGAHLVALNCAPVSTMMAALPIFSKAAKKAEVWFGCYPNSSEKLPDGSWNLKASNNRLMAACALDWMKQGAVMVGSCCHSTPRTTSLIENKRNLFYVLKEEIDIADDDDDDLPEYLLW